MSAEGNISVLTEPFLRKASRRAAKLFVLFALMTVACVVAGIWVDWRWLPTSIFPFGAAFLSGAMSAVAASEITRRAVENKDAPNV